MLQTMEIIFDYGNEGSPHSAVITNCQVYTPDSDHKINEISRNTAAVKLYPS